MYQHLFFDLDHTLWDFEKNSEATMFRIYEDFKLAELGIPNFESYFKNTAYTTTSFGNGIEMDSLNGQN